jgi:hypothetical protein
LKIQTDTVAAFTICAVIIAPYALWWMEMLEDALPGDIPVEPSEKGKKAKTKKNYKNILLKVLIDQTLGSCIQTFLFLMTIGYLKGLGTAGALGIVQRVCSLRFPFSLSLSVCKPISLIYLGKKGFLECLR